MPSQLHEALLLLFRNRPALAPELVSQGLHAALPEYSEARIESADLTDVQPTEYRADMVITLRRENPVFGIVVGVQLDQDEDKAYVWPVYAVSLRARMRCPVCLLVLTPSEGVARWARKPVELDGRNRWTPRGAQLASLGLDADRATLYFDLVMNSLSEGARRALRTMDPGKYQYQSEFARRYFSQGRAEGMAKGKAEGKAEIVIRLLILRFGVLPEVVEDRIRGTEAGELDGIAARVLTAKSLEEAIAAG